MSDPSGHVSEYAKPQVKADITTTITVIGNETGGQTSINVTVKKQEVATVS